MSVSNFMYFSHLVQHLPVKVYVSGKEVTFLPRIDVFLFRNKGIHTTKTKKYPGIPT